MPNNAEFFYPCVLCACFIFLSVMFYITYNDNKSFFDNKNEIKFGFWTGYIFSSITIFFAIMSHLATTCKGQGKSEVTVREIGVPLILTICAFVTLGILRVTYEYNTDIFNNNTQALTGYGFTSILFFIIIVCIIFKFIPISWQKCEGDLYKYNFKAFLPKTLAGEDE